MFTQKLTAWREKQRPETAWFQGKIQVEKSGGNLGHIYHVTPQQHLSPLAASSNKGGHFHCNHNVFTRFGRTQRTAPPSQGARWGAGWGTPGSKVGSAVGNPGEQGGERGGEPRGARWGAGWETPGSKVGSKVEEHRATHTTPQSRESQVDPMERLSPYSPQSHATYQSGAPRSPGAPHSR